MVKAARASNQPRSASQAGRSKRDAKALGWFALAEQLADEDTTGPPVFVDAEPLALTPGVAR
ncbi:hypothetical protein MOQ72_42650 [Saccharopolyspora sp. K220]|uniref:hypothetical protein n=1 Tax=Saccharopolyspora soli TaxID=2926618 RepID=UPI001F568592|nr:hypothetical protein [Saccharopolyspora soli]MCI2424116.1 hypothetical protein [Saccharopolyspora soli]